MIDYIRKSNNSMLAYLNVAMEKRPSAFKTKAKTSEANRYNISASNNFKF